MLERAIPAALETLAVGGRIVVLVLPVARGPHRQARARRGVELDGARRAADRAAGAPARSSSSSSAAPSWPATRRRPENPRATPVRLRAAERVQEGRHERQSPPDSAAPRRVGIGSRAPRTRLRPAPRVARTRAQRRARLGLFYAIVAVGGVAAHLRRAVAPLGRALAGRLRDRPLEVRQARAAALTQQKLSEDLDRVESPQYLAENAEALGMVTNSHPVYLRLSDGAVLGQPQAATAAAAASAPDWCPNCAARRRAARDRARRAGSLGRGGTGRGRRHGRPRPCRRRRRHPSTADLPTPATH